MQKKSIEAFKLQFPALFGIADRQFSCFLNQHLTNTVSLQCFTQAHCDKLSACSLTKNDKLFSRVRAITPLPFTIQKCFSLRDLAYDTDRQWYTNRDYCHP